MNLFPCLIRSWTGGGECRFALGDPLVDSYLAFVGGRCRPNTLRAVAHDLKTFFSVINKAPVEVVAADIFNFVAQRDAGVEGGGDERVAQAVGRDPLAYPCPAGESLHCAISRVAVHPCAVGPEEDRSGRSLTDVQVERPASAWRERDSHVLAALADDPQRPVPSVNIQVVDVGAQRFGDP